MKGKLKECHRKRWAMTSFDSRPERSLLVGTGSDRQTTEGQLSAVHSCLLRVCLMHESRLVFQSEAMGSGNGRITVEKRSTPDALSKRILGARGSHGIA